MSERRQKLTRQADALYDQWNEAKTNLEQNASRSVKRILVLIAVGYSLVYLYRLISSDDKKEARVNIKAQANNEASPPFLSSSRLTAALKTLLIPLLIKIVKREIMESTESKNK